MKKKVFNIFSIILLLTVFFMVFILPTVEVSAISTDKLIEQAEAFENKGKSAAKISPDKIAEVMKPLASLLLGIGTVVLVIITAIMGIKYMTATPDIRAKLKTQLIGIAVSAAVLFGAYGIWSIAYTVMDEII